MKQHYTCIIIIMVKLMIYKQKHASVWGCGSGRDGEGSKRYLDCIGCFQ